MAFLLPWSTREWDAVRGGEGADDFLVELLNDLEAREAPVEKTFGFGRGDVVDGFAHLVNEGAFFL